MTTERSGEYLVGLLRELTALSDETEWVEFKVNNANPDEIGEYISALSNSAALVGKSTAYLVWGVTNDYHEIVGTEFFPASTKIGNEELENWLLRSLSPKIDFHFYEVEVDDRRVVLLEIQRAFRHPVGFKGSEFIRVGSYKKRLKDFPEKERGLWRIFDQVAFEDGVVAERMSDDEVLSLLDYPAFFDLLGAPLPASKELILDALFKERLITKCDAGGWDISNLAAILFAKRLSDFRTLQRKAIRVVQYADSSRVTTLREQEGSRGYASGFEGLIAYINGLLPSSEVIEQALRRTVPLYPELAVRELVANALIHQDFFLTGTGPMVEIFSDRIEITNPGIPLVDTQRFIDTPPRSRNERLASLMRRLGVCEERGSGWDKVVSLTELYQMPAPLAEATDEHTRVVMFSPRPLAGMSKEDRIRAVYQHASLRYVNREYLTNASLRERFHIEPQNISIASRLIRDALEAGAIIPYDTSSPPKMMKYMPSWAAPRIRPSS